MVLVTADGVGVVEGSAGDGVAAEGGEFDADFAGAGSEGVDADFSAGRHDSDGGEFALFGGFDGDESTLGPIDVTGFIA